MTTQWIYKLLAIDLEKKWPKMLQNIYTNLQNLQNYKVIKYI